MIMNIEIRNYQTNEYYVCIVQHICTTSMNKVSIT